MLFKSKIFKALLITICSSSSLICQNYNYDQNEADQLFEKKRFNAVWPYYHTKLKKDSLNSTLNYKLGACYLNSRSQKEKAIGYLKQAILKYDLSIQKQATAYKLLGDAFYQISNFDEAIIYYKKSNEAFKNSKNENIEDVSKAIEICKMSNELKELKELTTRLYEDKTQNKKNKKNLYTYNETGSSLKQPSSIILPSKKSTTTTNFSDKIYYEEIQDAEHFLFKKDPKKADTSDNIMETTIATSIDGQIILIYRDDEGDAILCTSYLNGNDWVKPEKLNKNLINKTWEPNDFISINGQELYFSTEREGGFGGKDIYRCQKLTTGEWDKAVNMGPNINTPYDEEAPYLYADGVTLFFSSNRNRKKQYFDNFSSTFSDSTGWSTPLNTGYPIFKTLDDSLLSSNYILENTNLKENYLATFINQKKMPITILKGTIIDKNGNIPSYIEITLSNNETGEILGLYHPDSKNGKYSFIIPNVKNQNITFEAEGYLFHTENIGLNQEQSIYKLNQLITLEPIAEGSKITLNNIFFNEGMPTFHRTSDIELNTLFKFLTNNPTIKVEIASYVNKKRDNEYIKLTEERIQSILNFLSEKGIHKTNIKSTIYKNKKKIKKITRSKSEENTRERFELKILPLK